MKKDYCILIKRGLFSFLTGIIMFSMVNGQELTTVYSSSTPFGPVQLDSSQYKMIKVKNLPVGTTATVTARGQFRVSKSATKDYALSVDVTKPDTILYVQFKPTSEGIDRDSIYLSVASEMKDTLAVRGFAVNRFPVNMVVNGGFENDGTKNYEQIGWKLNDLTGWATVVGTDPNTQQHCWRFGDNSGIGRTYSASLKITSSNTDARSKTEVVNQNKIHLKPGIQYQWSFFACREKDVNPKLVLRLSRLNTRIAPGAFADFADIYNDTVVKTTANPDLKAGYLIDGTDTLKCDKAFKKYSGTVTVPKESDYYLIMFLDADAGYDCRVQVDEIWLVDPTFSNGVQKETASEKNMMVYPNPATSEVSFSFADNKQHMVQFFGLSGQNVFSVPVYSGERKNISHLPKGCYFVKVADSPSLGISKLIIQ